MRLSSSIRPLRPVLPVFLVLAALVSPAPAVSRGAAVAAGAATPEAGGRSPVAALDIREIRLDNGLRIFVVPRSASPTFAALYQFGVGGASDPRGRSGIAHLLEHMLFKGTTQVGTLDHEAEAPLMRRLEELWSELDAELDREHDPFRPAAPERIAALREEIERVSAEQKRLVVKNEYDEIMTRAGAVGMNASTNHDVTRYYVQLPSNRLEFWFRMESDRLLHPVFREFYSERDVVHEERRMRYENTAGGRAFEALRGMVFSAHPYGVPVIGWPRDIQRLARGDAEDYFRTYYSPSNCIMTLVGDVDPERVEALAKQYFGDWKRQRIPRLAITAEPEQRGERRLVIEFDAKPQLRMAWRTVAEGHADQYALDVLSMVLGGLYSSRIDETIVQADRIASRAGTGHSTSKYGGYLSASGALRGDHTADELEAAIEREIARIQADGITAEELERAKVAVEASRVGGLKSNLGQAFRITGAVFLSGGTGYIEDYERLIGAVTSDQVRDVARRYLVPRRKNVVEVRQVEGGDEAAPSSGGVSHRHGGEPGERGAAHSKGFDRAMAWIDSAPPIELVVPEIGKQVQRVELDGGTTVFLREDHSAPSIDMAFSWLGGSNSAPLEELAAFELASDLLDEGGTATLSPREFQARKDELGMSFSVWIGSTLSGAGFWSLKRNFDESFALALDVIRSPRLDTERLETLRGQFVEGMRRRDESPGRAASLLLRKVIYDERPRLGYVPSRTQIEAVEATDVRRIWKRYLGRDNLYVTVVGDFDAAEILATLRRELDPWREAEDARRIYLTHDPLVEPGVFVVEKELPQPAIRLYHQLPVDRTAPAGDHAALEILNDILGGSGFRSRLMERLRSDEGLTYGIYSGVSHEARPGIPGNIRISYQTKADSVADSLDSVLEEFEKIRREPVGADEVREQVEAWRNRFIFRYTNDFSVVRRLMYNELDDRPYDYDRRVLADVQKVDVKDVRRVARRYLDPGKLTVAIFGKLTEGDRKRLADRWTVTVLPPGEVFTGGYDEAAAPAADGDSAPETAPGPARGTPASD